MKSSGSSPTLQSRYVTPSASTQYVTPQSGYDGLSQVTVSGDSNLVSSNIKNGVSIFGVNGNVKSSFKFKACDALPSGNGVSTLTVPVEDYVSKIYSLYVLFLRMMVNNISSAATRSLIQLYQYSENGMSQNYDSRKDTSSGALFRGEEGFVQFQFHAFDWEPSGTNIILSFISNPKPLYFGRVNFRRESQGYLVQLWYE